MVAMLLSFGDSEHRLDLTIPASSLNHLKTSIPYPNTQFLHTVPNRQPAGLQKRPLHLFEDGGACILNANHQLGVSYSDALGTLTHRTRAVCKNFTWLATHRGSLQSSQDLGICSNCFTNCCPLNLGWLLIHQDPSSKPPRRKMLWES